MNSAAINVRNYLMMPRPEWNRRGPHIPPWFRRGLQAIDPYLRMQYMPPAEPTAIDEGVDKRVYPNGVWMICRMLPRTRMLFKQATWIMTRPGEAWKTPRYSTLRLIKYARDLWKNKRMHVLTDDLDRDCSAFNQNLGVESRQALARRIDRRLRKIDLTKKALKEGIRSL